MKMTYRVDSMCLWMLMLACVGSCAVLSSRGHVNVIRRDGDLQGQEITEMIGIKLPQFLAMGIKYSFARSWITKSAYMKQERERFCDENELQMIKTCEVERLYTAIDGGLSKETLGESKLTSGDFKKNLMTLCREYDVYKRCLQESLVDKCGSDQKSVVDILYSHICSDGKQDLMNSDAGMCLSNLKMSSVVKVVKATTGCEYYFTDLSTSLQAMFSAFHNHDAYEENEAVAIRENLLILCRYWHTLEKCLLPAYGKLCGKSAETFYATLVDKIKGNLAYTYKPYGYDLDTIAKCSAKTGVKPMSTLRRGSSSEWIFRYVEKQRDTFSMAEKDQQLRCGPCAPLTTSFTLTACFWQVADDIGIHVMDVLSQLSHDQNEICRLLMMFNACYDGHVSDCSATSKVDFNGIIRTCNIMKALNRSCFDALADVQISTRCGSTLSEITEYYLFKGAGVYLLDQISCSNSSLIQSKLDLSCFEQLINVMGSNTSASGGEESCIHFFNTFLESLKSIIVQSSVLFGRARDAMCKRNCGDH